MAAWIDTLTSLPTHTFFANRVGLATDLVVP